MDKKMMVWIVSGGIFLLVVFIFLFSTTTEVRVVDAEKVLEEKSVDYANGYQVINKEFEYMDTLILKDGAVYFSGISGKIKDIYKYIVDSDELIRIKTLELEKDERLLGVIDNNHFIVGTDEAVFITTTSGKKTSLGNVTFFVSKSGARALFYKPDSQSLWTYNANKHNLKTIKLDGKSTDLIKISPDGEYFLLGSDKEFSVVGTDTGRTYVKNVIGRNPEWSEDENKISFYFTGEPTKGERFGVLDMTNKKIKYFDGGSPDQIFLSGAFWDPSGQQIYFIYKKEEATFLCTFDLKNLSKKNYTINDSIVNDPDYIYGIEGVILLHNGTNIKVLNTENNLFTTVSGVLLEKNIARVGEKLCLITKEGVKPLESLEVLGDHYLYDDQKKLIYKTIQNEDGTVGLGYKIIEK